MKDHAESTPSLLIPEQSEPEFVAIPQADATFEDAYASANRTLPRFIEHLQGELRAFCSAKLSFRVPDASNRPGKDQFLFLWLIDVHYDPEEGTFSGSFFDIPREMRQWYQMGQRVTFEGADIFDWSVLTDEGRLFGGYTLRVSRSHVPEQRRVEYDRYIGVRVYEAIA